MANVVGPNKPQLPYRASASGRTPVADFIVNSVGVLMAVFIGPFFVIAVVAIPAFIIVFWVAQPTGLLAAWSAMVIGATGPTQPAVSFAVALGQDLIFGAGLALLLALPGLRRALESHRVKFLSEVIVTPTALGAAQVGFACLAVHVLISGTIAAVLASVGVVLPIPAAEVTTLLPLFELIGAGGPPPPDVAGTIIVMLWIAVVLGGIFVGVAWGGLLWTLSTVIAAGAAGAASGSASALGTVLAGALTNGKRGDSSMRNMVVAGTVRGAIAGAAYTLVLIGGAAIFGLR